MNKCRRIQLVDHWNSRKKELGRKRVLEVVKSSI